MTDELPGRIGELAVLDRLGAGGFGVVYLAFDPRLDRNVAVKVAHPGRGDLLREARAAARLAHPNVVAVYEIGEHEGALYLVMEYVDGPTLSAHLANKKLTLLDALRIARDLTAAVAAAHREGVVHLDLTPSNVLLAPDGRARVVDFGLAYAREAGKSAIFESPGAGTPEFMAPEQRRGEIVGPAADIWALGAIMQRLFGNISSGEAPPLELAALINRCLHKQPTMRPDAAEMAGALEAVFTKTRELNPYAAEYLYGRDEELAAIVAHIEKEQITAIVAPSGAGKTSLLQRGVIPRLLAEGWTIAETRPGSRPLSAIAAALARVAPGGAIATCTAGHSPAQPELEKQVAPEHFAAAARATCIDEQSNAQHELEEQVASWIRAPERLAADLADLADMLEGRFVLVIDQLEELETEADAEQKAAAEAALAFAIAEESRVRFCFAVRDDFAGAILALEPTHTLAPLPPHALRDLLVKPAGDRFDEGLAERIAGELAPHAAAPALAKMIGRAAWAKLDHERGRISREIFETIGGAAGAAAIHAEEIWSNTHDGDHDLFRRILLRFFSPGTTPRSITRKTLLEGLPKNAPHVLERLIKTHVILTNGARLELVHADLATRWTRLAEWLAACKSDRRIMWSTLLTLALALTATFVVREQSCATPEKPKSIDCTTLVFPTATPTPHFNAPGLQDAIAAISDDGKSALNFRRACSNPAFQTLLIDTHGETSTTLDLTDHPALKDMFHHDAQITMTGDALTIIGVNTSYTGFLATSRSARGVADFAQASSADFTQLFVDPPTQAVHPVISSDRLAFYFTLRNSPDEKRNGNYESVRASTSEPFPPAEKLPDDANVHLFVTGISNDRLALFLEAGGYTTVVLTRRTVNESFRNPNYPIRAPMVPGFRIRPIGDCTRLIGTCVGGCNSEDTCIFER